MGAENAVTLRDLGIFVDQAAEPVSTQDPGILAHSEWTLTPGGRSFAQRPVRAMNVIVLDVLTQDQPQVPFAGDQHPVQALAAGTGIQRSAIAFARGAWTGVLMIRTPGAVKTASKARGELGVAVPDQELDTVSVILEVHQ